MDNANGREKSMLLIARVQLIFDKFRDKKDSQYYAAD